MVLAIINLKEHEDRVLNVIKGNKYGLKNKSPRSRMSMGMNSLLI